MTTAVVPTKETAPVPSEAASFFGADARRLYSSIAPTDAKGKAQLIALLQGKAEKLSSKIGETITLQNIVAHEVEMPDEDGVVTKAMRTVLVTKEGTFQAVSEGVARSLMLIFQYFGEPSQWGTDGIKVKVEQIDTANKRRFFLLTPVA